MAQGTGDDLFESGLHPQTTSQTASQTTDPKALAGSRLGPYRIVKEIGSGGMGVVYQALDTRLGRSVAIKVLPEHIANDQAYRRRFESEARAVASLSHPHICTLYDIGKQGDTGFMVMELIEGQSLAARLVHGSLPLEQALQFADQIADAIDRAHRAGVTHRDVKPANIMINRDGVKLLDFGLARSSPSVPSISRASLDDAVTTEGAIGTPQYMAPEQFAGHPADARADVWAFGAVLYEMLTGHKAFAGKDYSNLVAAILAGDSRLLSPESFAPPWVERLVRRCLSQDPDDRYQSMRDVVLDLRSPPPDAQSAPTRLNRWLWVAVSALVAALAVLSIPWKPQPPVRTERFEVQPPSGARFGGGAVDTEGSAISPDGRTLAFMATTARGDRLLHIRAIDELEARPLPGTESAGRPFWSPNSKSIAFVANHKLKRVDIVGGAPITLCDSLIPRGGSWSERGVILFADTAVGLLRIPESGGKPSVVAPANRAVGEPSRTYPHFLPGGEQYLFLMGHSDPAKSGIFLGSLDGRPDVRLQLSSYSSLYDPASRRLLYIQGNGTLMAQRLDLGAAALSGDPVVVAENVGGVGVNGYGEFSLSRTGALLYARGAVARKTRFIWRDRTGRLLEFVGPPVDPGYGYALSPDDQYLAYTSGLKQEDLWVMPLAMGLGTRLSFAVGNRPAWSSDGKSVYYTNDDGIYKKPANGAGDEVQVFKGGPHDFIQSISNDQRYLFFGHGDIFVLPLGTEPRPQPYLQTKFREFDGTFSPDGRWVTYFSDESGRNEVYMQGFPDRRGKWLVSTEGGLNPRWRGDGRELYWIGGDNHTVTSAPIKLENSSVKIGKATALFRLEPGVNPFNFQPSRDGRRFLTREPETGGTLELPMVLVKNWAASFRD